MSEVVSKDTRTGRATWPFIRKLLAGELNPPPAEGAVVLRLFGQVAQPDRIPFKPAT